jgi:hypothetical protein
MNYYSQLLTTAFRALTNAQSQGALALTYAETEQSDDHQRSPNKPFRFPSDALPQNADIRYLRGGDSFLEEALAIAASSDAKCVFVYPPFLGELRYSNDWRERQGMLGYSEAVANHLLITSSSPIRAHSENTLEVLAMLVPSNFASSMRTSRWRQEFFPAHSAVVIEHEHADVPRILGLEMNSVVRLTTVIFQRKAGPIRFFKITDAAVAEGPEKIARDLGQLLRQPAGKTRYGYVYQGAIDEGYPCSYDYYSEETEKLRQEVGVLGEKVSLLSIADVFMGFRPCPQGKEDQAQDGFLYINGRDIRPDGRVDVSEARSQSRPSMVMHYLQDGDFCIRQISSGRGGLAVGVFESDGRPITFSPNVIVVRPHPSVSPAQRQVLLSYLRSPLGFRLADAKQTFSWLGEAVRVSPRVLSEFPVPLADKELVTSIQRLSEAKAAFTTWIAEIDQESNAIIEEATAAGSRKRLLGAGRLARQRHRAGEQVEELDYRIRTQFPHPLAYAWRKLQVAGSDRYHRLDAVLQAAENHTCFLALVAILISRSVNQPLKWVNEIAKRLSGRKSGTNFGDWLAILQELNEGKAFLPLKGAMPFAEVADVHADKAWAAAIAKLKTWRDDDCHGRISTTKVPEALLAGAEAALEEVYRATEFLTDYRFMFITETRFDSIRKINRYQYRDLTGDNTLAQRREDQADRADLESQSLYLMDRQGQLHLFRPLLHYLECPECHLMSTFHLDTYDATESGGIVGLKSFETSSVRKERVAEDFRHVGLLP